MKKKAAKTKASRKKHEPKYQAITDASGNTFYQRALKEDRSQDAIQKHTRREYKMTTKLMASGIIEPDNYNFLLTTRNAGPQANTEVLQGHTDLWMKKIAQNKRPQGGRQKRYYKRCLTSNKKCYERFIKNHTNALGKRLESA